MKKHLYEKAEFYLHKLCNDIKERTVGTKGNIEATDFFYKEISSLGWETVKSKFNAIDWKDEGTVLKINDSDYEVYPSPYSLGCDVKAELLKASTLEELELLDAAGKLVLLYGDIAKEQIMPKHFVFYNPEEHQKLIYVLENKNPKALICATGRCGATAGGVYPFPLFEDGDFNIPSVYMTEEEGSRLSSKVGKVAFLKSVSERILSTGYNVVATKGNKHESRIVVTAHIDAKKGTPGAMDNATGVIVLLLLADILKDYNGDKQIEIAAFNGEDYYSVPGQMKYISENQNNFDNILFNINIDGAGYKEDGTAISYYNFTDGSKSKIKTAVSKYSDITEGIQWPQGDHSIFVQFGRPAIAVTSKWFLDNFCTQDITHTPKDNPSIVDCNKLVDIVYAIADIILSV